MKKIVVFVLGFFVMISLSSFFGFLFRDTRPESTRMAHKIVNQIKKKFKNKYGLYAEGVGEEGPSGKYKRIAIYFSYRKKKLSKDEGRALLVHCVNDALEVFNSYPEFQQHMENVPFNGSNIAISIFVHPLGIPDVYYPDIGVFSFFSDTLWYDTNNPRSCGYYTEEEESFEEAQKIVSAQARGELPFKRA